MLLSKIVTSLLILQSCSLIQCIVKPPIQRLLKYLPKYSQQRVVGGSDIPPDQFVPYQVSLQYLTRRGEQQHFCGGSIISANRILTAAHCCDGLDPKRMSVLAGIRNLNDSNGQRSQVASYEMHENYMELVTSDIAILTIEPPLDLDGERMQVINVNGTERVGGNVPVTLTGWGLRLPVPFPFIPDDYNYPTMLQTMNYQTMTNENCREMGMSDLTDTEICAQSYLFKGACSGDSGGPLVMATQDGGLQQVGIVSYGFIVCGGLFGIPDVYTRVSVFRDWIQERLS